MQYKFHQRPAGSQAIPSMWGQQGTRKESSTVIDGVWDCKDCAASGHTNLLWKPLSKRSYLTKWMQRIHYRGVGPRVTAQELLRPANALPTVLPTATRSQSEFFAWRSCWEYVRSSHTCKVFLVCDWCDATHTEPLKLSGRCPSASGQATAGRILWLGDSTTCKYDTYQMWSLKGISKRWLRAFLAFWHV